MKGKRRRTLHNDGKDDGKKGPEKGARTAAASDNIDIYFVVLEFYR